MKTLNKCLISAIVLSIGISAGNALAHEKDHHGGFKRLFKELELTTSQRQDLRQQFKQQRQDAGVYRDDMRQLHQALAELIQSEQWQEAEVRTMLESQQQFHQSMGYQHAQGRHYLWSILDQQQRQALTTLVAERPEFGKERNFRGLKGLQLSDEQQQQLDSIRQEQQAQRLAIKQKLEAYRVAERELIQSDEFNQEAWLALNSQYAENFIEQGVSRAHGRHQLWQILTEEQRQQLQSRPEKRRHHKGKHSI